MIVLVTGGAGFVMSNLVRHLLETDAQARVVILDRDPLDSPAVEFFRPVRDRLTSVQGDVRDRAVLDDIAAAHPITHVVHAATVTHAPAWEQADPARFVEVNVMGTVSVLEWARALPGLQRFIYVSSGAVYGFPLPDSPAGTQPEAGPFNPPELYAITKRTAEMIARRYGELFGLDVRQVRFSAVFGPMERPTSARVTMSLPHSVMQAYREGRPLRVTAETLEAGGDFLSAEDVAEALARLLRRPRLSYEVYNIAYGVFTSVPELLAAFRSAVGPLEVQTVAAGEAEVAMDPSERRARWNAYAIERIAADTGWRPRPLEEQWAGYLRWVRGQGT